MATFTPITKRLRAAQGETGATLTLLHQVHGVELYARQPRRGPLDYAVVRRARTTYGATPTQALRAMRVLVVDRQVTDQRPLTWQTGIELGFSPTCLLAFCRANGLDYAATYPLATLRRTCTQHLAANWPHYARGLRRVGIHLTPPPASDA